MDSRDAEAGEIQCWVLDRLNRLVTLDPLQFSRKRVPRLGDRSIDEALDSGLGGAKAVEDYLDRLAGIVGMKLHEDDYVVPFGLDPQAIEAHPKFRRLSPQWVEHPAGWQVGFVSRFLAGYRDGPRVAKIGTDLLTEVDVPLRVDTLTWIAPETAAVSEGERDLVISRLREGLAALGARPILEGGASGG